MHQVLLSMQTFTVHCFCPFRSHLLPLQDCAVQKMVLCYHFCLNSNDRLSTVSHIKNQILCETIRDVAIKHFTPLRSNSTPRTRQPLKPTTSNCSLSAFLDLSSGLLAYAQGWRLLGLHATSLELLVTSHFQGFGRFDH